MLVRIAIEVVFAVVVCGAVGVVAEADGHSWLPWAGVTLLLCVAGLAVPLPLVRELVAGYAAVGLMFGYNLVRPVPR